MENKQKKIREKSACKIDSLKKVKLFLSSSKTDQD